MNLVVEANEGMLNIIFLPNPLLEIKIFSREPNCMFKSFLKVLYILH